MSDLYYFGDQAMLKHGTEATPIPKVAADEIERLQARVDELEAIVVTHADPTGEPEALAKLIDDYKDLANYAIDGETRALIAECVALQEDK